MNKEAFVLFLEVSGMWCWALLGPAVAALRPGFLFNTSAFPKPSSTGLQSFLTATTCKQTDLKAQLRKMSKLNLFLFIFFIRLISVIEGTKKYTVGLLPMTSSHDHFWSLNSPLAHLQERVQFRWHSLVNFPHTAHPSVQVPA